jgi:hypothetical protein
MRFHEPDVREAYRRGARDCYEGLIATLKTRQARQIETWLNDLDGWEDGDPPPPPVGLAG